MLDRRFEQIVKEEIEAMDEDLRKWFGKGKKGDWVDISRKNKDGSHPACGDSSGKGKRKKDHFKAYPKCVPRSKAKSMSASEKKSAVNRKRNDVKKDKDKSTPTMTKTDSK